MVKQTRKYIETGMRETAEEAGNKGRSMTHEAIGRATRLSGDIVSLFLALIEKICHIQEVQVLAYCQTMFNRRITN